MKAKQKLKRIQIQMMKSRDRNRKKIRKMKMKKRATTQATNPPKWKLALIQLPLQLLPQSTDRP
jgi:hypothetical protein